MSFSDDEVERYARHLVLREVGGPGQQRLKRARVLVIGAGNRDFRRRLNESEVPLAITS